MNFAEQAFRINNIETRVSGKLCELFRTDRERRDREVIVKAEIVLRLRCLGNSADVLYGRVAQRYRERKADGCAYRARKFHMSARSSTLLSRYTISTFGPYCESSVERPQVNLDADGNPLLYPPTILLSLTRVS